MVILFCVAGGSPTCHEGGKSPVDQWSFKMIGWWVFEMEIWGIRYSSGNLSGPRLRDPLL